MKQMNFLEMGPSIHCLRCHQDIPRDEFVAHSNEDTGTCEDLKGLPYLDPEGCGECMKYRGTWVEDTVKKDSEVINSPESDDSLHSST